MTSEKQRETFRKELAQTEDWLYEDGASQTAPIFMCVPLSQTPIASCKTDNAAARRSHAAHEFEEMQSSISVKCIRVIQVSQANPGGWPCPAICWTTVRQQKAL